MLCVTVVDSNENVCLVSSLENVLSDGKPVSNEFDCPLMLLSNLVICVHPTRLLSQVL